MTFRGWSLVGLLALGSGPAVTGTLHAQQAAVMVPPRSDQIAVAETTEEASEELARLLRERGLGVISPAQASAAAEGQQTHGAFSDKYDPLFCITPACAEEYRKLFAAKLAVQLSVASRSGRPTAISIIVTEGPTVSYTATAPVEGGDIKEAVREAFAHAFAKLQRGGGPWLSVTGTPERAIVYIDDTEVGPLPIEKRHLAPGPHRVEIRAADYANDVHTVHIPSSLEHEEKLAVALQPVQPASAMARAESPARVRRTAWDWTLGSVVAAAGTASLIAGIYVKTQGGECTSRENGMCTHYSAAGGPHDNLMIGLGAAGLAVGGLVMGLGPIGSLTIHADRDRALLRLKGQF